MNFTQHCQNIDRKEVAQRNISYLHSLLQMIESVLFHRKLSGVSDRVASGFDKLLYMEQACGLSLYRQKKRSRRRKKKKKKKMKKRKKKKRKKKKKKKKRKKKKRKKKEEEEEEEEAVDDLSAPGYHEALLKKKWLLMFRMSLIPPSSGFRPCVVQGEGPFVPQQNLFH